MDEINSCQLFPILYFIYSGLMCWPLEISPEEIPQLAEACVFLQVRSGVYSLRERLAHSFRGLSSEDLTQKQTVFKNLLFYEQIHGSTETLINHDMSRYLETMLKERIREIIKVEYMLLNTLVNSAGFRFQNWIFNQLKHDPLQNLTSLNMEKEPFIQQIRTCVERFVTQDVFFTTIADYCFQQTRNLPASTASTREVQLRVSTLEGAKQIAGMVHKDAKEFLTFLKSSLAESKLLSELIQKKGIGVENDTATRSTEAFMDFRSWNAPLDAADWFDNDVAVSW